VTAPVVLRAQRRRPRRQRFGGEKLDRRLHRRKRRSAHRLLHRGVRRGTRMRRVGATLFACSKRARRDSNSQPSDTLSTSAEVHASPLSYCTATGYGDVRPDSPGESGPIYGRLYQESGDFVHSRGPPPQRYARTICSWLMLNAVAHHRPAICPLMVGLLRAEKCASGTPYAPANQELALLVPGHRDSFTVLTLCA
jgi:hypothetical protein